MKASKTFASRKAPKRKLLTITCCWSTDELNFMSESLTKIFFSFFGSHRVCASPRFSIFHTFSTALFVRVELFSAVLIVLSIEKLLKSESTASERRKGKEGRSPQIQKKYSIYFPIFIIISKKTQAYSLFF